MSIYAIGDVQGCRDALQSLLERIHFDASRDRLWFTGDLVNRGPQSAEVLRFVRGLGDRAVTVLGNHDLHLLAVASGCGEVTARDSLDEILNASDRDGLLDWLRRRPLLHHDEDLGFTLTHAGLLPQWDLETAQAVAREVEDALQSQTGRGFFGNMYGDEPHRWQDTLNGWQRLRVIVNGFTRLRFCDGEGRMDFQYKGPPGSQPAHLLPWFQVPGRRSKTLRIIFGHWSLLSVRNEDGVICLDTGCVWGRALTAVRLAPGPLAFFAAPCVRRQAPRSW